MIESEWFILFTCEKERISREPCFSSRRGDDVTATDSNLFTSSTRSAYHRSRRSRWWATTRSRRSQTRRRGAMPIRFLIGWTRCFLSGRWNHQSYPLVNFRRDLPHPLCSCSNYFKSIDAQWWKTILQDLPCSFVFSLPTINQWFLLSILILSFISA